jgi:hypothetical protein
MWGTHQDKRTTPCVAARTGAMLPTMLGGNAQQPDIAALARVHGVACIERQVPAVLPLMPLPA